MITRRVFLSSTAACLSAPGILHAQEAAFSDFFREMPRMRSFQVLRGDDLVFAEVRAPGGIDSFANIKSVSVGIVSLLLGTAFDRGEITSVDATIGDLAPRLLPRDATPGAAGITVQDLVTMRAGLEPTSGPNYGSWVNAPNWVSYALSRPFVAVPGTEMTFSTGASHVLGAVLAEVTGQSLYELAQERLGVPLGIEIPPWTRDPQGYYFGGNEMALRPSAMLRIATMLRDGGRFEERQVVSGNWMLASTQKHTRATDARLDYGYGWFLTPSGYVLARGYGGQIIAAHVERGLAVAITSDPTVPSAADGYLDALMAMLDGPILALS
jgi:CubicO group peptidase (beta-lactamase class C family)